MSMHPKTTAEWQRTANDAQRARSSWWYMRAECAAALEAHQLAWLRAWLSFLAVMLMACSSAYEPMQAPSDGGPLEPCPEMRALAESRGFTPEECRELVDCGACAGCAYFLSTEEPPMLWQPPVERQCGP